jgi:protocatechuate 3,4-dioxygenase alpha subunit
MEFIPNASQTVGPFFHFSLTTENHAVKCIAGRSTAGERVWLTFRVVDGQGVPLDDAMIEIWQADANGRYNHPDDPQASNVDPAFKGFGRQGTGDDGICEFETIRPGRVAGAGNVLQAPHLNVSIFARGLVRQLHTRVYFAGDPANQNDPVLALVPADRRETLMAQPEAGQAGHWRFDVRLQGAQETVFFDL